MEPTAKPSLDTAYALIDRAGEHLEELRRLHDNVIAAYAKATVIEHEPNVKISPGEAKPLIMVTSGHKSAPIPPKLRVLIEEISNNLRSALNYLVARLAEIDTPGEKKGRNIQFPIERTPDAFKGQRPSYLAGVNDAHAAAVEVLQPFEGSDPWLQNLAGLSNLHKHDDLVIVTHDMLISGAGERAKGNPSEITWRMKIQPVLKIALGDGLPIIDTLEVLKSQVTKVLDSFKPEF